MAFLTAYDILKLKVQKAEKAFQDAEQKVRTVQELFNKDQVYVEAKRKRGIILAKAAANSGVALQVGGGKNAVYYGPDEVWYSDMDNIYPGNAAIVSHNEAKKYIADTESKLTAADTAKKDAQIAYDKAKKELENYEATSPIAKSAIAQARQVNVIYIIGGLILLTGLIVGAIFYFRKPKTQTT